MSTGNIFHAVPAGENLPEEVNVIIEISEGSRVKYEFEKKYGTIFVDRFLKTPIPYPFSYGLIPKTWNEYDNDPLDAIVVASEPLHPGCVVPCRVVGMLSVDDSGERDDKILAIPTGDGYYKDVNRFEDLPIKKRENIHYFMEHYKDLELGKTVIVKSWDNAETAKEFIGECLECYEKKFGN
ncbi:inorganic diphosphatase [Candidatus Peregrinibacteria bacterium]|nr:MAG: inorganic diphosphatase [Candidatus Peregrinibacteria bacterium]